MYTVIETYNKHRFLLCTRLRQHYCKHITTSALFARSDSKTDRDFSAFVQVSVCLCTQIVCHIATS